MRRIIILNLLHYWVSQAICGHFPVNLFQFTLRKYSFARTEFLLDMEELFEKYMPCCLFCFVFFIRLFVYGWLVHLSSRLFVLFVCLWLYLYICSFVYGFTCVFVSLLIDWSIDKFVCLLSCLTVYLPTRLCIQLYICLFVYLYIYLFIY